MTILKIVNETNQSCLDDLRNYTQAVMTAMREVIPLEPQSKPIGLKNSIFWRENLHPNFQ